MDLLDRMLGHDQWITTQLLEVCNRLTDAQLDQEFDIGLRDLRTTFDHMIYNLAFWTDLMLGQPTTMSREDKSIPALLERHASSYAAFDAFARNAQAEQRLDETYRDHFDNPQSVGGTIVHVVVHNHLHRSEALHMFQRLGIEDVPDGDPQEWEHRTGRLPR